MVAMKANLLRLGLAITVVLLSLAPVVTIANATIAITPSRSFTSKQAATASATEAISSDSDPAPLDWPVAPPTIEQIAAARQCKVDTLAKERYAGASATEFETKFNPVSACDWAALAVAYASNAGSDAPLSPAAKRAFLRAVGLNGAVAFIQPLLGFYFGKVSTVKAPPISNQPVVGAEIELQWQGGLGVAIQQIDYRIVIAQTDSGQYVVSGMLKTRRDGQMPEQDSTPIAPDGSLSGSVDAKLVQALGSSLTDMLPIPQFVTQLPCTDNYPDWRAKLTFKDGTGVELLTNRSNIYFAGGPWQMTLDRQKYFQYSGKFVEAVVAITQELKMPRGTTAGMFCGGVDDPFGDIFGKDQPVVESTLSATSTQ